MSSCLTTRFVSAHELLSLTAKLFRAIFKPVKCHFLLDTTFINAHPQVCMIYLLNLGAAIIELSIVTFSSLCPLAAPD